MVGRLGGGTNPDNIILSRHGRFYRCRSFNRPNRGPSSPPRYTGGCSNTGNPPPGHMAVFHRIAMDVIHMSRKIPFVTDEVFSIPALPDAAFSFARPTGAPVPHCIPPVS